MQKKPIKKSLKPCLILLTLDGWGVAPYSDNNLFSLAHTPVISNALVHYPSAVLDAGPVALGSSNFTIVDSRLGHKAIRYGCNYEKYRTVLEEACRSGQIYQNADFQNIVRRLKRSSSKLCLLGYLGSDLLDFDLLEACLEQAKRKKITTVSLFLVLNCDTEIEALEIIKKIEELQEKYPILELFGMVGSDYAMNISADWKKTEKVRRMLVNNEGHQAKNPVKVIKKNSDRSLSPKCLPPTLLLVNNYNTMSLGSGDSLLLFNHDASRLYQLISSLTDERFNKFKIEKISDLSVGGFAKYPNGLKISSLITRKTPISCLAILEKNGLSTLTVSSPETITNLVDYEKKELVLKSRIVNIGSESSALFIEDGQAVVKEIEQTLNNSEYDFIMANISVLDRVVKTKDLELIKKCLNSVDELLGNLIKTVVESDALLLLSSSCGHLEKIIDPFTGEIKVENSNSNVPLVIISKKHEGVSLKHGDLGSDDLSFTQPIGSLKDLAVTVLSYFNIEIPKQMNGKSLL